MEWENVDDSWLRLYIRLNRDKVSGVEELDPVLPKRRPVRREKEAGMNSLECKERECRENDADGNQLWPSVMIDRKINRKLIIIL